jgi:phage tail-like protein
VPPVERKNPYSAFNFEVIVTRAVGSILSVNDNLGSFMEVSGLDGENTPIEYREGTDQAGATGAFVRKMPGMERYPNITMRRGISGGIQLWTWRKHIRDTAHTAASPANPLAEVATDLKVILHNENHDPVFTWILKDAWLSKLSGPSLNAKSNEIAIESAEIVCQRIEIEDT